MSGGDVTWTGIDTPEGEARVGVHLPAGTPRGTIVLGHGAGGPLGSWPRDLQSVRGATAHGWAVVLVEQPWRVAGRKVATRPPTLDTAWRAVVPAVVRDPFPRPLVVGGRSAGARVACRTSPGDPGSTTDPGGSTTVRMPRADAVLCLAFPLHPPGRPERSRAAELAVPVALGLPTLVVQGTADPFGSPAEVRAAVSTELHAAVSTELRADTSAEVAGADGPGSGPGPVGTALEVVEVPGNHSPSRDQDLVTRTVLRWLDRLG